eukprot:GHVS01098420.1.p2 GENE.GHVS01098420.1~~GHVS01098420.1.p2  ORF type:complete len:378 (+),score=78.57 GHVS01098420.1:1591-2724(+)
MWGWLWTCCCCGDPKSSLRHLHEPCPSPAPPPPRRPLVPGLLVAIGGLREMMHTGVDQEAPHLVLAGRSGIFRVALQTGAKLVPVYGFGEERTYIMRTEALWLLRFLYGRIGKLALVFIHCIYGGKGVFEPTTTNQALKECRRCGRKTPRVVEPRQKTGGGHHDGNRPSCLFAEPNSSSTLNSCLDDSQSNTSSHPPCSKSQAASSASCSSICFSFGSMCSSLFLQICSVLRCLSSFLPFLHSIVPHAVPLHCVVSGRPIVCRKIDEPSDEQIDALRDEYVRRLCLLFARNKGVQVGAEADVCRFTTQQHSPPPPVEEQEARGDGVYDGGKKQLICARVVHHHHHHQFKDKCKSCESQEESRLRLLAVVENMKIRFV